jgi:hypothetical protein
VPLHLTEDNEENEEVRCLRGLLSARSAVAGLSWKQVVVFKQPLREMHPEAPRLGSNQRQEHFLQYPANEADG